jgi:hypothetical protein
MFGGLEYRYAAVVLLAAFFYGGRNERPVALALGVYTVFFMFAMQVEKSLFSTSVFILSVVGAMTLVTALLAAGNRRPWLLLLAALQAGTLAIWVVVLVLHEQHRPVFDHEIYPALRLPLFLLAMARDSCLFWAVGLRWAGPPRRRPGRHGDVDLCEAAAVRC